MREMDDAADNIRHQGVDDRIIQTTFAKQSELDLTGSG
jgi:hypothetical protein